MSFKFALDPAQEAATDFIMRVGRSLQDALVKRKRDQKLTQQALATKLNLDRSRVNRCFSGYNNLTLSSLAELVWALDGRIDVSIILDELDREQNHFKLEKPLRSEEVTVTASSGNIAQKGVSMPSRSITRNRTEIVHAG